jgi:hypothetical protein
MDLTEQEVEQIRIMRLPPGEYAALQRAKHEARMTDEQKAERDRLLTLPPDVRHAEMLLRQKISIEKQLRSASIAAVLADPEKAATLADDAQAEAAGFALRGTVVKG